jgi:hypothetical protein
VRDDAEVARKLNRHGRVHYASAPLLGQLSNTRSSKKRSTHFAVERNFLEKPVIDRVLFRPHVAELYVCLRSATAQSGQN